MVYQPPMNCVPLDHHALVRSHLTVFSGTSGSSQLFSRSQVWWFCWCCGMESMKKQKQWICWIECYPCFFVVYWKCHKRGGCWRLFLGHVDLVHAYDLLVSISIVMYSEDIWEYELFPTSLRQVEIVRSDWPVRWSACMRWYWEWHWRETWWSSSYRMMVTTNNHNDNSSDGYSWNWNWWRWWQFW